MLSKYSRTLPLLNWLDCQNGQRSNIYLCTGNKRNITSYKHKGKYLEIYSASCHLFVAVVFSTPEKKWWYLPLRSAVRIDSLNKLVTVVFENKLNFFDDDVWLGKIDLESKELVEITTHIDKDDIPREINIGPKGNIYIAGETSKHHVNTGSWDGGAKVMLLKFDQSPKLLEKVVFGGAASSPLLLWTRI